MRVLSIATTLRLTLIGLTLLMGSVAAVGVARLYDARQRYENVLAASGALATAAANLSTAAIGEQEVLRDARGPTAKGIRRQAAAAYASAATTARALSANDSASRTLIADLIATQTRARSLADAGQLVAATAPTGPLARARALTAELQARQTHRQTAARATARSQSQQATVLVLIAGSLALVGAFAVIATLVARLRAPLSDLVEATRKLAGGDLDLRVVPSGPLEIQELGAAFNLMGEDLSAAARHMQQERHRLAVTIESLGDGLIVTEPDAATIAASNPRARELLPDLVAAGRIDLETSPLADVESALEREHTVQHRGRTLSVRAATLGAGAEEIVFTIRDTTERARLEQAKSDFVATASHELRSPLTSIKGFVELLQHSGKNMTERQREFISIILRSTDRLVDLVNDLLDVARIEAGHVEISRKAIDVAEAAREVCELMGARLAGKSQTLELQIENGLPPAYADAGRVRQIVANLLTNAHLYTPDGGRLEVICTAEQEWVRIDVSDSGRGMTRPEVERVFERFFRAESGRATPGTGLGLAIVKSLIELHDGKIEVQSERGAGTTFTVRIPIAVALSDVSATVAALDGRRVLVVDDDADIADLIANQLETLGVTPTVVTQPERVLEMVLAGDYDAITLDILMAGTDGFEVLRQLRDNPVTREVPVVFVSVYASRKELAGELVVSKPIDPRELGEVLAAAVSSGRSSVLVVAREELQAVLEPSIRALGIEYVWVTSGAAAARVCGERRFETALLDVGMRHPRAVLQALDLRGRRVRREVILVSDGSPVPDGIAQLGMDVVDVHEAAQAVQTALDSTRGG
jgi:signal transduction histidine kinase/DNA-binding response OmpR family regulator